MTQVGEMTFDDVVIKNKVQPMQQGEKYIEKSAKVDYKNYQRNNKPTLQEKNIRFCEKSVR